MAIIDKRIDSSGKVHYRVRIRLKGFPLETATFKSKTKAKQWAQSTEAKMRDGRYFKTSEGKNKTLKELIERYEQDILPARGRDRRTVAGELQWWKQQLGPYTLADITPQKISACKDALAKDPIYYKDPKKPPRYRGAATIIRYLATLSVCFTYAVKDLAWIEENPVLKVRKPTLSNGRTRFLTVDESESLLTQCKEASHPYLYTIVLLALSTGARMSEILNLQWKDIDFQKRVMRIEQSKNGEKRSIPLTSQVIVALSSLNKLRRIDSSLVFPRQDGKKPVELKKHWKKAVEKANLEGFRFHDLRHTAASNLAMEGASLLEIATILGHKQLKMVQRYAHLTDQHTAELMERTHNNRLPKALEVSP